MQNKNAARRTTYFRVRRPVGWFALFALVLALSSGVIPSLAQSVTPDQLQQLQQAYQQRQDQNSSNQSVTTQNPQQDLILQPAVPVRDLAPLPPSRLEQILSARAGTLLKQFGYDQFGMGREVRVPINGGVQDDYILGPGDEVVVSLRGQENSEIRASINRDGQVILPRLNPLAGRGRSLGALRQDIQGAVRRADVD